MVLLAEDRIGAIGHIFHPTDLSPPSMAAFGHALKLTVALKTDLTIMHVAPDHADADFEEFPRVRATLARWGLLPEGATKEQLLRLGLGVRKIRAMGADPVDSVVQFLWHKPTDLVVLATHERDELSTWFHKPAAEDISRKSRIMTLFVPEVSRGFISLETGECRLKRILIPVDHGPSPQPAVDAACALAASLKAEEIIFHLLYVGDQSRAPTLRLPFRMNWQWHWIFSSGVVFEEILSTAERGLYHLIVMGTQWRHGFLDALCGSTTERVLRHSAIPLLAVPEPRSR